MKPSELNLQSPPPIPVAAYVRMAAVCQNNPTSKQMDVIQEYARRNNMEIIKVYSDEGKSGLNIKGRDALLQMLADAQSGRAGFFHILVYDVSRWGRSQDMDEAAYYESICNRAGITVHYCADQSHNDGSIALIIKTIKRSIAVESNGDLLANGLPEDDALDWMI